MKKILVSASRSFVARNILERLNYDFTALTREQVNLEDKDAVDAFFKDKQFDVVIHTACVGGRRGEDSPFDYFKNLIMFQNLYDNRKHFKHLINFGSGADDIWTNYGMAKKEIADRIEKTTGMINLRCFGIWGKYEKEDRFPTYCMTHDEVLVKDRLMRYIHVDDLVELVDKIIKHWPKAKEITVGEVVRLSEFAKQLNPDIKVIITGTEPDYV